MSLSREANRKRMMALRSTPKYRTAERDRDRDRRAHRHICKVWPIWRRTQAPARSHCHYCRSVLGLMDLEREHVIPTCQGGPTTPDNLVLACRRCNAQKNGRTEAEWVNRWYWHGPPAPYVAPEARNVE